MAKYSKRQREYMKFNKLKRYSAAQRAAYWKKKYLALLKSRLD